MTTQTPTIAAEVQLLDVESCYPNPWNKERPLDEPFLQSFRDKGQIVIGLVRPHPTREGEFEIIYGARRWAASKATGHASWMAEVRDMDDAEAEELCAVENAQRAGLSWQQQCELIANFLERHTDEDASARIGAALGISTAQVKRRARMLKQLNRIWLEALIADALPAWTVDHFELIAVLSEKSQENLWKHLQHRANGMTVTEVKEEISDDSNSLDSVPWELDDVTLVPKAGACIGCPYRDDAQPDLFAGAVGGKKSGASCLNGDCFGKKLTAHTKRKEAVLLEKHPDAVKVNKSYSKGPKDALRSYDVTEAKKGDKGAVPAITYGDGGKVTLGYVKVKKAAKEPSEKSKAKDAAKKREARIQALAIDKLIAIVRDPDTEFTEEAEAVLVQFCMVYGGGIEIEDEDRAKRVLAYKKKPVTLAELWDVAADRLENLLDRVKWGLENGWGSDEKGENPEIELAAWLTSTDFADLVKEATLEIDTAPAPSEEGAVPGSVDADIARDGDEEADLD